jgi:hypothetical protein
MSTVSIAVVTYNSARTIAGALSSVFLHMPEDLEFSLYVIDNGSTDNTFAEIEPFMDRITLIKSPEGNIGFGAAHNLVLSRLDSAVHIIMNPDITLLDTRSIPALFEYIENHPDVGMAVPQILDTENRLQYLCRRQLTVFDLMLRFLPGKLFRKRKDRHVMKDMDYTKPFDVPFASGCLMAIRTDLFRDLGGFDEGFFLYAEDADLTNRVNRISRTVYVPEAKVCHEWERASYKHISVTKIHIRSLSRYFRKWGLKFR